MVSPLRKLIAVLLWILGILLLAIGVLFCLSLVALIPGFICVVIGWIVIIMGLKIWPISRETLIKQQAEREAKKRAMDAEVEKLLADQTQEKK